MLIGLVHLILAAILLMVPGPALAEEGAAPQPILILVSLDGFRWDYLDLAETPHLSKLAAAGVRAEGLIPVFPSKTFPSHYSIATGLYPGHHGIISNNMIDAGLGAEFQLHDRDAVEDPRWWGGEPIWVTAERQGVTSATLFWPGSETEVAGVRPTYWSRFDREMAFEQRVGRVLSWIDLPAERRPRMIALYLEHPNDIGHEYGPEAAETFSAVRNVDARIGDLVAGIEERGLIDRVDLVIVSDHGMAEASPERTIFLDSYLDLEPGEVFEQGALLQVYPRPGREAKLYHELQQVSDHLSVFRREEIPERYHLRESPRAPPILGVPDVGWLVATREAYQSDQRSPIMGDHGQDPNDERMHGIFIAHGPAFRSGVLVERIHSVEIYNLLARVLGLEPAPNDGTPGTLSHVLDH